MIEEHEAMPLLVAACPSFAPVWNNHLQEWGNDVLYSAAGDFAHHLLQLYRSQQVADFPAIGVAIERLHVEGSAWVKEFATIGVLEDIQNVWSHSEVSPDCFFEYLGPQSKRWWLGLDAFWLRRIPLVKAIDPPDC